jgi:F-type H+-transporting ATPase subunit epsilon
MSTFTLVVQDATQSQQFDDVSSFVGEDTTGSFGIMAGHTRFITTLVIGLARFKTGEDHWTYIAAPGAVVYFVDNTLTLSTRHYLIDDDFNRISQALEDELLAEEEKLRSMKESLHQMEDEILKRLWEMGRKEHV